MTRSPTISVIVTTYQRPRHLALVLESIAAQRDVDGQLEVVVTDDGSTDETSQIVANFSRRVPFAVRFVTHLHTTFRAAKCRNDGAREAMASYLLFLDGDCLIPPDHLAVHLQQREQGRVLIGDACRIDRETSERITADTIRAGDFSNWLSRDECRRLRKQDFKYRFYNFLHHPTKPYKLRSGNFSLWRSDFERVNGFDENFEGWGGEDDDLGRRLRMAGTRLESIVRHTHAYHIWHPREATAPDKVKLAANTAYLWRKHATARCENGLVKDAA